MASYKKKAITNALVNVAITGGAQIVHHTSGKDLAFQSDNVRKTTKRDTFLLHTAFRFTSNFFFKANLDCLSLVVKNKIKMAVVQVVKKKKRGVLPWKKRDHALHLFGKYPRIKTDKRGVLSFFIIFLLIYYDLNDL